MSEATDKVAEYLKAETAAAAGKSYSINNHSFTRADLPEIAKRLAYWQSVVRKEASTVTGNKTYALADFT